MPVELFVNEATTTVTSGGTTAPAAGTSESWTPATTTGFPTVSPAAVPPTQFRIKDPAQPTEKIIVTDSRTTPWTVTRGAEGTTPVAHLSGFTIGHVLTAGALGSFLQLSQESRLNVVTMFGADLTGTTDSTTAINNAIAQVIANGGGVLYFPAGTYRVNSSLSAITIPGVRVVGDGRWISVIKFYGSGDCFRMYFSGSSSTQGGGFEAFTLDGTNATGTATGIHAGDIFRLHMDVHVRGWSGSGQTGVHFDNNYSWTEQITGRIYADGCATHVMFDNSVNTSGSSTGSFDRVNLDVFLVTEGAGDGVTWNNGAFAIDGHLGIYGNASPGAAQYYVLKITGQNTAGYSYLRRCNLNIGVECATGSGTVPGTIAFGTAQDNYIAGCTGFMDFGGNQAFALPSNFTNSFQFTGPIWGDTKLMSTQGGPTYWQAGALSSGGYIQVLSDYVVVTPTASITGVILGTYPGVMGTQSRVTIINPTAYSITMAAAATSHVATGTADVIPPDSAATYLWDPSGTPNWYRVNTPPLVLDTNASDIQPLGTQAAGSVGLPADSGHVHPTTGLGLAKNVPAWINVVAGYGADPTGAADSTIAIQNAITAATTLGVGALYLPPGTYKTTSTITCTNPGLLIFGDGMWATAIDYYGSGDCLRMYSTQSYTAGFGAGVKGIMIDGTNASAGACGLHFGDIYQARFDVGVRKFQGTNSKGIWFDNQYSWCEDMYGHVFAQQNTQNVVFDNSANVSGTATGSFARTLLDIVLDCKGVGDGLTLLNGANVYNSRLTVAGNMDYGPAQRYAINLTGAPSYSFTATNASPCVFTATGSYYYNGLGVTLSGGSLPAGFTAGTYYVVSASGSTFELAATSGGAAIGSTTTGSGTVQGEYSRINTSILNVVMECNATGSTYQPITINFGAAGNSIRDCTGIIDFSAASAFASAVNWDGSFQFDGICMGDPDLMRSAGVAQVAYTNGVITNGAFITTRYTAIGTAAPASNVTGVILGTSDPGTGGTHGANWADTTFTLVNQGAGSITFAALGTSHVATGTACVIPAGTSMTFAWVAASSTWYPVSVMMLDTTGSDIQALGTQAAGSKGQAADAEHVHPTTGLLLAANNLSDVGSAATARTSLGLGTAATQASSAFDAAGAATTAQANAEAASLLLAGGTMSGAIAMGSHKVTGLTNGSASTDAAAFGQIPVIDTTASDIQAVGTAAAAGAKGQAADSEHIHLGFFGGIFGDGSDGSATLDGTATVSWATKAGSTYTLSRDAMLTSLTINSGVTLQFANCYRIFCKGTFTNGGTLYNPGNAGQAAGSGGTSTGSGPGGTGGRAGGSGGSSAAGGAGGGGQSVGQNSGGAGGAGSSTAGGVGGTQPTNAAPITGLVKTPFAFITGYFGNAFAGDYATSAPGGGGGGGDGTHNGGGGGSGGSSIIIFAYTFINNGSMNVSGGAGATPTVGNCGGGGGGGGGWIIIFTLLTAWTNSGTYNVAGGAAGSGVGSGSTGTGSSSGYLYATALT